LQQFTASPDSPRLNAVGQPAHFIVLRPVLA